MYFVNTIFHKNQNYCLYQSYIDLIFLIDRTNDDFEYYGILLQFTIQNSKIP